MLFGRGDHLAVADRTTRLDDRDDAALCRPIQPVPEGEIGVGGEDGSLGLLSGRPGRHLHRGHPVHLPSADAHRGQVVSQHDGVRLHAGGDPPGEQEVLPLIGGRLRPGHHLHVRPRLYDRVHVLDQSATVDGPDVQPAGLRQWRADHPEVRLLAEYPKGLLGEARGYHHFREHASHGPGGVGVHLPVESHDAAERGYAVPVQGACVRLPQG